MEGLFSQIKSGIAPEGILSPYFRKRKAIGSSGGKSRSTGRMRFKRETLLDILLRACYKRRT